MQRIDTSAGVTTNEFGYNPRSELISALMGANAFAWVFDSIGNRITASTNSTTFTYTANSLNQYTSITDGGLKTLSYDTDGNLTNDSVFAYTWDGENRMAMAEPLLPTGGAQRVRNAYDYMGRRVEKIVDTWDGTSWVGQSTNQFIYDGWNLIQELQSTVHGLQTNSYVWGLDLSGSLQGAGGVGGLLAVVQDGAPYFPCYDGNGNVTDYVDTNGVTVAHREYDAYGNTIVATGPMVNDFNFWFSTKYLDQETGLYYYGYRYYSPSLGRWLSRDPIGELGFRSGLGQNRKYLWGRTKKLPDRVYAFCENNPLGFFDVLGLNSYHALCKRFGFDISAFGVRRISCFMQSIGPVETCGRDCVEQGTVVAWIAGVSAGVPVELIESVNRFEIKGTCKDFAGHVGLEALGITVYTLSVNLLFELEIGAGRARGGYELESEEGISVGGSLMAGKSWVSDIRCVKAR